MTTVVQKHKTVDVVPSSQNHRQTCSRRTSSTYLDCAYELLFSCAGVHTVVMRWVTEEDYDLANRFRNRHVIACRCMRCPVYVSTEG